MDRGRPSRPAPRLAGGQHRITADHPDTRTCRELPLRHRPPVLLPRTRAPSVPRSALFVAYRLREPPFAQARRPVIPVRPQPLAALARPLGPAARSAGPSAGYGSVDDGDNRTNLTPPARIGHARRLRLRRDPPQVVLTRETGWSYTREIRWSSSEEIGRSSIRKFCIAVADGAMTCASRISIPATRAAGPAGTHPQAPVIPHETAQDNDAPPQGIGAR